VSCELDCAWPGASACATASDESAVIPPEDEPVESTVASTCGTPSGTGRSGSEAPVLAVACAKPTAAETNRQAKAAVCNTAQQSREMKGFRG
jgi:hypothetical protein